MIPEGYGAGVVMLWDKGTWTPEAPDVDAALAKGDLKFTLDGYKLKGSWVLVRTRGYGGSRGEGKSSWLLIKHRDEWSGDLDIATFAPLSVKSNQDFPEILADDQAATWQTNRPAAGAANAMLRQVIEKAAALKHERDAPLRAPAKKTQTLHAPQPMTSRETWEVRMRKAFVVAAAFALATTFSVGAMQQQTAPPKPEQKPEEKAQASVAGKWDMTIDTDQGAMQSTLDVKTGRQEGHRHDHQPAGRRSAIEGEYADGKLTFSISFDSAERRRCRSASTPP